MNTHLIGQLIRLRYKLMWAKTRTRNGKIALFAIGYLLLVLVLLLFGAGGVGAGVYAVRSGRAQLVCQIVLGALFVQTLVSVAIAGFGMNAIFSDSELRRYPINELERRLTRHLIGIIDPFWLVALTLETGLVTALALLGGANFALGMIAVLLLVVSNYLTARLFAAGVDRLMRRKAGQAILMVALMSLSFSGIVIPPLVKRFPGAVRALTGALAYTPPFGAAAAMTQSGLASFTGFTVEIWWLLGLAAALVWLERRPPERRAVETTAMSFDSGYDRVAAALGFDYTPLVGWWLRFYARNTRFKALIFISFPFVAFLTYNLGARKHGAGLFVAALGTFPILTFFPTSRFMVNQFGYLGGGYRRCFLLPVDPATVLRTGSYASMLLSAGAIPLAAIGWAALAPVPFSPRELFMLVASMTAGLFLFHALGLWATLYGARRGNYGQTLGNDLSLVGNIVLIGGVMACMFVPSVLHPLAPAMFDPANWWMWTAAPVAAVTFYGVSLGATSARLPGRREALMAIVEGKA